MAKNFGLLKVIAKTVRGRKPYMKDLDTMYTDATCYESEMRYPIGQKLLWECNEKVFAFNMFLSSINVARAFA